MIFAIECIAACVLFTAALKLVSANREEVFVNDYPPVVTDKLRAMGLVAQKPPARKSDIVRKLIALVVFAVLFALLLRFVNGITGFWAAAFTAYGLWLVVDILMAPFDKFYKLAKVSMAERSAVWFHCKASVRGMVLGLLFAPLAGLLTAVL